MIAGFSAAGTDRTPAVQAPSATKLMCPKETTPELPMNAYSATTIATLTSALMKYVCVECENTVASSAAATTSSAGTPSSTTAPALRLTRAPRPVAATA